MTKISTQKSNRLIALFADGALLVEFRPDYGCSALYHGAVYLDVCFVATNGRDAIIAGASLLALKGLATSQFSQLCRCGCS